MKKRLELYYNKEKKHALKKIKSYLEASLKGKVIHQSVKLKMRKINLPNSRYPNYYGTT